MDRIFFLTGWRDVPSAPTAGGPKVLLQHVGILRAAGLDAHVVVFPRWTERWLGSPPTPTVAMSRRRFEAVADEGDVVVVPAVRMDDLRGHPGRAVLMVQNGSLLFRGMDLTGTEAYPWHGTNLAGVITVSEHDRRLVEMARPGCPVCKVFNTADPETFVPTPWSRKEPLIVTAPLLEYKNPWHTSIVIHLLRSRRLAAGERPPEVKVLQGVHPSEMPGWLGRASALIFLSISEGFGLLPMEAVLCGTPVVAYPGQAHDEFLPPDYLHTVSDFAGMVETLESILDPVRADHWARQVAEARERVLGYSAERQRTSVLEAWSSILDRPIGA